jgi:hypothetical protein
MYYNTNSCLKGLKFLRQSHLRIYPVEIFNVLKHRVRAVEMLLYTYTNFMASCCSHK